MLITLKPGSQTQDFTSHKGVESGYVLEGTIEVHIKDKQPIVCREEDSVEELAKLCDIAMEGDRGIVSSFAGFRMELQDTIASGGKACRIVITKETTGPGSCRD